MKGFIEIAAGEAYPGEKVLLNVARISTVKPVTKGRGCVMMLDSCTGLLMSVEESYDCIKRLIDEATAP